jgi:hypothetical protein
VLTKSLPSNRYLFLLDYSGFQPSCHNIFYHIDPDAEICGPVLSDSCSNSDDGQGSANVGGDDDCGDDDDKDDDNEDWALWDKNYRDFYMIPFPASSGYKTSQNGQMFVSVHKFLCYFLV